MGNNGNIIELKHITKVYEDGFAAVSDFNLEVKRGEFVTFLGPSGCGKTTTLRMIAGFDLPTEGDILLNGKDISQLPPNMRPINTVFQRYALFPHMNIFENIAFGLKQKKMPKDEIRRKVRKVLELVDLEGFEHRSVSTLSGGQQQRVAIARALVNEPEILLLDEPLGALDLKMRKEMQLELKAMHDELGITFIYVTHDQEEALTMSDKIVVMSEGKIQQIGTPEDIYNEPANAFVADFIGESNIFNGIMTGPMKARFAGGEFVCVDDVPEGTQITAVVRPEDIVLTGPERGQIRGRVISVIFKGIHYEITVESGRYEVVIQSTKSAKVGDQVGMEVEPDGIHIMIAEDHTNVFNVDMNRNHRLEFNGTELNTSLTQLIRGSHRNENHELLDENGEVIDPEKVRVTAAIEPQDIRMTDDTDDENVLIEGTISNLIYKGDHYSYVINTELGQDFIVDDEYLWNMGDLVGLIIPIDKMRFTLKK
ncbi:MAG: polyamine ABC transporter ATP-binding protein [Lachnospiraceae bacterium]|nr:polyamine ABC transporter ATP-binding protein [Lachnospiraceae bacterium]MBP5254934.1 polyamine ABC transporter ATP-binding protein [Lachnospiraceae bacterium]